MVILKCAFNSKPTLEYNLFVMRSILNPTVDSVLDIKDFILRRKTYLLNG